MDAFVSTATADHDRGFFYEAEPDEYEAAPDDGTVLSDLTGGPRLKGFLGLGSRTAVLDGRFESFAARIPGRLWLDVSTRHAGHEYFASRRVTLDEGTLDRASVEVELELAHRDR